MSRERIPMPDTLRKILTVLSILAPVRPLIGPVRASVEVSTRCNFSCLMCAFFSPLSDRVEHERPGFMTLDLAGRVFDSAAKMRVKLISFTGRGEPLLHPHFVNIVRMVSEAGLQSEVFTNGSLLTRKRIEGLIEAGLGTLAVSLVGATSEGYAAAHPGVSSGTFEGIIDSLALLQRMKREAGSSTPKLVLRFIALKGSQSEVEEMVRLGIRLAADSVFLSPLRNRSVGIIGTIAPEEDEEKLVVDRLREMAATASKVGLKTNLEELAVFHRYGPVSHLFPCYAGWFDARVRVDGTVDFCVRCDRSLGNVKDRPLEDIWLDSKYRSLRTIAMSSTERSRVGRCDCDRCCHFHSNWRITRLLSTLGLTSKPDSIGRATMVSSSSQPAAIRQSLHEER